ncbi:MAG: hypothetical protein PHQ53_04995 [Candidatus Krumholzibacteria bacterium]|nr:hypothetical protein [Candidatus Krumholzibacteria bacterium]
MARSVRLNIALALLAAVCCRAGEIRSILVVHWIFVRHRAERVEEASIADMNLYDDAKPSEQLSGAQWKNEIAHSEIEIAYQNQTGMNFESKHSWPRTIDTKGWLQIADGPVLATGPSTTRIRTVRGFVLHQIE